MCLYYCVWSANYNSCIALQLRLEGNDKNTVISSDDYIIKNSRIKTDPYILALFL